MRTGTILLSLVLLAGLGSPLAWSAPEQGSPSASEQGSPSASEQGSPSASEQGSPSASEQESPSASTGSDQVVDSLTKDRVDLGSSADREAWVTRIRAAYQAIEDAKLREDDAAIGYGKARHKNKTRGDAKRKILEERQESRGAVAEAEAKLDEVLTQARRAGVPPGWVREARSPAGPANRN